ncbi:MAG: dihydroneopterin aldolase [Candidatus Dormibacteria bacterium]|nr:dihydroneopterin aldolase [Chloroflexota bacterium]HBV93700.1 dihydroneopterin aldolase [Chloroflexota bacterium]
MSPTPHRAEPTGGSGRPDEVVTGRDVLRVEGMRFFGHHGCLADERGAGVHLDVDVEVRTDTRGAARTDRVEDTIDYARLVEKCRRVVEDSSYHLVETVAERLAETLLEEPRALSVLVRVAKRPPLPVAVDRFSVTVERTRS